MNQAGAFGDDRWQLARREAAAGRIDAAAALYAEIWRYQPADPAIWIDAARVAARQGRDADIIALMERAHALAPADTTVRLQLLTALARLGRNARVLEVVGAPDLRPPAGPEELSILGYAHRRLGDDAAAERCYRASLAGDPANLTAMINLANLLEATDRMAEAAEVILPAADHPAATVDMLRRVVLLNMRAQRPDRAVAAAIRSAKGREDGVGYLLGLGKRAYEGWHYKEALLFWQAAESLDPGNVGALTNLASAYRLLKQPAESERVLRQVLDVEPDNLAALNALGNLLIERGDAAGAIPVLRRTLEIDPGFIYGKANLIRALLDQQGIDEAAGLARELLDASGLDNEQFIAVFGILRRACDFEYLAGHDVWPHFLKAADRGRFGGMFDLLSMVRTDADAESLLEIHRKWAGTMRALARKEPLPPRPRPAAKPRFRIGVLSSDLRQHVVSIFMSPVFAHYDRSRYEIVCYSPYNGSADRVERLIASRVDRFVRVKGDAPSVARMIREDGIDALYELNGFTKFSQTGCVAWQPARAHISYLGYPFSTGLREMDFTLVDRYIRPPTDRFTDERYLDVGGPYYCFGSRAQHLIGFDDHMIDREPHVTRTGHITFGTFNNPFKYTPDIVAAWARVLHGVPGSRLNVVRPEGKSAVLQANLRAAFAREGIDPARIIFEINPPGTHTFWYNRVDICLDTFPQTGGTTTCESLWMGVPTVSLVGNQLFGRLSRSILSWAGLQDLCHDDLDGYVRCAVALAGDIDRLRELRRTLRDRILASPMGDERGFTRRLLEAGERAVAAFG